MHEVPQGTGSTLIDAPLRVTPPVRRLVAPSAVAETRHGQLEPAKRWNGRSKCRRRSYSWIARPTVDRQRLVLTHGVLSLTVRSAHSRGLADPSLGRENATATQATPDAARNVAAAITFTATNVRFALYRVAAEIKPALVTVRGKTKAKPRDYPERREHDRQHRPVPERSCGHGGSRWAERVRFGKRARAVNDSTPAR